MASLSFIENGLMMRRFLRLNVNHDPCLQKAGPIKRFCKKMVKSRYVTTWKESKDCAKKEWSFNDRLTI